MQTQSFSNGADNVTVRDDGDYSLAFLGGDDTLTINGGTNTSATMGDGNDYVRLISGLATVQGQAGADRFDIWASGVTTYGGADNDLFTLRAGSGQLVYGDDGNDRLNFTAAISNVTADLGTGDDAFVGYGSAVSGSLYGGAGNDSFFDLSGGSGLNLYGGTGNDAYRVSAISSGTIVEYAGEGSDTVQLARGMDYALPENVENIIVGSYAGSSGRAAAITGNAANNGISGAGNAETIYGFDGNDHLYGKGGDDSLWGGTGNDTIDGGLGNDLLRGEAGNDVLVGREGDDTMVGGTGNDTYYVDSIGDVVTEAAGEGTDTVRTTVDLTLGANIENGVIAAATGLTLYANALDNTLYGSAGDDCIFADGGNDVVSGGAGNDYLGGESGNDTVIGGSGNDYVYGDEGNDILQGGDGSDYLQGYTGDDLLDGGNGDDLLAGGTGADVLMGGAGSDTFFYYDVADSTASATDRITDFSADDQLDLSLIDADVAMNDDQAFAGLGNAPAAHSLWFTSAGSNADGGVDLTIYGDVNGDTVADFAVILHASAGFSTDDITL